MSERLTREQIEKWKAHFQNEADHWEVPELKKAFLERVTICDMALAQASGAGALPDRMTRCAWCNKPVLQCQCEPQAEQTKAVPQAWDGDWTEDYVLENGHYMNARTHCRKQFHGHKRRVVCKVCATKAAPVPSEGLAERLPDIPPLLHSPIDDREINAVRYSDYEKLRKVAEKLLLLSKGNK